MTIHLFNTKEYLYRHAVLDGKGNLDGAFVPVSIAENAVEISLQGRNFNQPNVGVGLAVIREGHVLLHQRRSPHAYGKWAFPGGHLEKFESFSVCARRELVEEAGSNIEIGRIHYWDVMNTMFHDEDKHYVVIFMWADWISGDAMVMEPDKNAGWQWWSWDNLPADSMQGLELLKKYHPHLP